MRRRSICKGLRDTQRGFKSFRVRNAYHLSGILSARSSVGLTHCSRKWKAPIVLRKEPLKEILASLRAIGDVPDTRRAVRSNFDKVLKCRTGALGSEVYASSTEHRVVHHTCKSRACTSCGHRATSLCQRECGHRCL